MSVDVFGFLKKKKPGPSEVGQGAKQKPSENPYLNAKRQWNDHVGNLLASKRMWQAVALLSLLLAIAAVGGIIHIGSQSKFVPYIVQVDKLGQAVATARADQAAPVDNRIIIYTLASFISDARMVTPDVTVQRTAVFNIYAHLTQNDPASIKMNEWLNGNPEANPFKRASKETVSTEIISVIPQSAHTWQVDWRETVRDRQGAKKNEYVMRALITIEIISPTADTKEEQILRNPLGLFVRDFNWSKQS